MHRPSVLGEQAVLHAQRLSDQVSDNRHGRRRTPGDIHGRSVPGQACCDAGSPGRYLASGRRGHTAESGCSRLSRRLRCALPRPGAAPGSALGARPAHAGPARADTRRSISSSPAHRRRDAPHASLLPWQPAARRARSAADTEAAGSWGGSLICSRLCSPPGRFPAAIGSGTHLPCHACLGRNDGYHAGPQEMDSSWVPGTVRDLQGTVTPAA